ncbi:hypothetical protein AQJ43_08705 [Streptomyces avermitilis]|nr:hypothetical protein AQJ43_08705 [Streptomyces avermitilis]OOV24533.1 hypothetical protein SM007_29250 [Streptomyces avermitilis]
MTHAYPSTNLLGNCVAVFAVSRWEGALDTARAKKVLDGEIAFVPDDDDHAPRTDAETPEAEAAKPTVPARSVKEPAPEVG